MSAQFWPISITDIRHAAENVHLIEKCVHHQWLHRLCEAARCRTQHEAGLLWLFLRHHMDAVYSI